MTAIEFLHSEYKRIFGDVLVKPSQGIEIADALAQAKEMEEQQIKTAYGSGIETMRKSFSMSSHIPKGAQEYYNDTFNK